MRQRQTTTCAGNHGRDGRSSLAHDLWNRSPEIFHFSQYEIMSQKVLDTEKTSYIIHLASPKNYPQKENDHERVTPKNFALQYHLPLHIFGWFEACRRSGREGITAGNRYRCFWCCHSWSINHYY